jgi:hypothetical protein
LYFENPYLPDVIPRDPIELEKSYICSEYAPYKNITSANLFKTKNKLKYPINIGRNLAKKKTLTHFILAMDLELYPNPKLIQLFLKMIAGNASLVEEDK